MFRAAHIPNLKIKTFYKMIKSEIFADAVRAVCEVTEMSVTEIMSRSRSEEVVDARYLLVSELRREGYYPSMIARRMRLTSRAVRQIIAGFDSRASRSPGLALCRRRLEGMRKQSGDMREATGN